MPHPSSGTLRKSLVTALAATLATAALAGCDSVYYSTMKRFGMEKRDILVKRVREARKSQNEAREEFKTAIERFKEVVDVPGSSLEDKYDKLNSQLERSEDKAKKVHEHIDDVRKVSKDLFKEWQNELGKYSDRSLRAESERELAETRRRADALIASMERAEKKIAPVLQPLRDRVLFLKHNLNARAIGALDRELVSVRGNVETLVAELQQSISEADAFIKDMDAEKAGAS